MILNSPLWILACVLVSFPSFAQNPQTPVDETEKQGPHVRSKAGHSVNTAPTDADLDAEFDKFAENHCDWPTLSIHNAYQRKSEFQKSKATAEELQADELQRTNVHRVVKKLNELSITGINIRSIEIGKESRPLNESGELVIAATATDAEIEKVIKESVSAPAKTQNPLPDEDKIDFVLAQNQKDPRAARLVVRLCKVRSKFGIRLSLRPWDGDDITLKEASDIIQMLEALETSETRFKDEIRQVAVMSSTRFAAAKIYSKDPKILLIQRNQKVEGLADFLVSKK